MFSNKNHNNWSAEQLSAIIDSIRETNNGKCSLRMVGERIGKSIWSTWQLLRDAGLSTRLYEESLNKIFNQLEGEGENISANEAFDLYGTSWKNINSFKSVLCQREILSNFQRPYKPRSISASKLLNDYKSGSYDFSLLCVAEIAEMYELDSQHTRRVLKKAGIPFQVAKSGPKPKVKA